MKQVEQLTSRITDLEQLIRVGKEIPLFAAANNDYYKLSSNRRKVISTGYTGEWHSILSEKSLSEMGNKFQISLDVIENGQTVMIGVANQNTDTTGGVFSKTGSWMLCISKSHSYDYDEDSIFTSKYEFFEDGIYGNLGEKNQFSNGSLLVVSIAPSFGTNLLSFELDGALLHIVGLSFATNTSDLLAAVDLRDEGTSVSFV